LKEKMNNYIVATVKPWNIDAYHRNLTTLMKKGRWHLVTTPESLQANVDALSPRYIFFPHWSWKVPEEITDKFECVCFHMTDVPYGRGGSPLQNLILLGHTSTKLSALKMERELDAGPVYRKLDLLLQGSAQDIYQDVAQKIYAMIVDIIESEPLPVSQQGEIVTFDRRTEKQSELPASGTLEELYDHIRMLDAETYPHAYIQYGDFRIEFTEANLVNKQLSCSVSIRKGGRQ
jgi:methionyl-tRNA formyltransferase